jgi:pyrroline-5-carboxylate reductase
VAFFKKVEVNIHVWSEEGVVSLSASALASKMGNGGVGRLNEEGMGIYSGINLSCGPAFLAAFIEAV